MRLLNIFLMLLTGLFLSEELPAQEINLWRNTVSASNAAYNRVLHRIQINKPVTKKFVQEKKMVSIGRTLLSGGLIFISPKGICWKTTEPFVSVMKLSKRGIEQRHGSGTDESKSLNKNMQVRYIAKIMMAMFVADKEVLEKEFELFFIKQGGSWQLGLKPKRKMVKRLFASVIISGASGVEQIIIKQPGGDISKIRLSDSAPAALTLETCVR